MLSPEEKLSRFIERLDFSTLPDSVVDSAKKLLLDFLGVMCLSYEAETTEPFIRSVRKLAGDGGDGIVVGSPFKLPFHYAAMLNGALAHSAEFDDTNALGHSHPGAVVIPTVLAAAQMLPTDGRQFITGIAAGYETMCRVGAALGKTVHHRGFHVTPLCGIFGAVAAAGKVLNLDARTIDNAMGLAGSLVAGSHQFTENGAWNKRLHPGFMAHHALMSIQFAQEGVIGAAKPLTGQRGFFVGYTDDPSPELIDDRLGQFWYTDKTAIKPYPACRLAHGAIDVVMELLRDHRISADEVTSVTVDISPRAFYAVGERTDRKLFPTTIVDAQFSIYFQVAAVLLIGLADVDTYRLVGDDRIASITPKITVNQFDHLGKLETHITVQTTRGEFRAKTLAPKGEPENALSWDDTVAKYGSISKRLGERKQQRLAEMVKAFDELEHLAEFYEAIS